MPPIDALVGRSVADGGHGISCEQRLGDQHLERDCDAFALALLFAQVHARPQQCAVTLDKASMLAWRTRSKSDPVTFELSFGSVGVEPRLAIDVEVFHRSVESNTQAVQGIQKLLLSL